MLKEVNPAAVLVQGDTTTAFAGAVAAFYEGIPVGHVEAGLRTGNLAAPFPEEGNRRLISTLARWHFAPTSAAADNLRRENVPDRAIFVTGNTVVDALQLMAGRRDPITRTETPRRLILVTGHRRESFGDGIENLCRALLQIAREFPETEILYPVHPNPNVIGPVHALLGGQKNIQLCDPLDYLQFVSLLKTCYFVITDSGGIQEEAPALGKPVLVTRDVTERPEAVEAGCAKLVGTDTQRIVDAAAELLSNSASYQAMANAKNPFGDGTSSKQILEILRRELGTTIT